MYLFIYDCWVSVAVHGLSLVAASERLLHWGAQASLVEYGL